MRRRLNFAGALAVLAALLAGPLSAEAVELAGPLTDHMVLQRGKRAPIWGTGKPGESVVVGFAGQSKPAKADAQGNWLVRLDPLKASSEPRKLTVKADSGSAEVQDVLVGDVWVAGGQSNMGRRVQGAWQPKDQRLDYPQIRYLAVKSKGSKYPTTALDGNWAVCTAETTPLCTGVGFFFAERIHKATGIPQGILWNAVGGSVAREWIPRFGWRLRPELKDTADKVDRWYPSTPIGRAAFGEAVKEIAAWRKQTEQSLKEGTPVPFPQPMLPEPDDGGGRGRGTTILYNGRMHPLAPYAVAGIVWWQGESDYANRGYVPQIEAMVESWRQLLACPGEKCEDLAFYFVQMQRSGSYMSPQIRDQQFQSYFTIPNSGMAVLIDLDIQLHPNNRYDAGRRLALWALAERYGKDVIVSGPLYKGHRVDGSKVIVEFSHTHGGLFIGSKDRLDDPKPLADGKLTNLEITADGRTWVPAQSQIVGNKLVVWADDVPRPTDVRYCWKSIVDEPFLYNNAGLPAAQFNTTSPYKTENRK